MGFADQDGIRLDGKLVVITGGSSGIGKETALELSRLGARILMLCRNMDKADIVRDQVAKESEGIVDILQLDLSSLRSVRACAEQILHREHKIDILINNAAVMKCPDWKTEDGFEMQFGTNHLGHFLLTELLLPLIKNAASAYYKPRILVVSCDAHRLYDMKWEDLNFEDGYDPTRAYCQSKLANLMFAAGLAKRLIGDSISVFAVNPGGANTDLHRYGKETLVGKLGHYVSKWRLRTAKQAAKTTLYCCLEEDISEDSGTYYANCREALPHERACNESDQKRLWLISQRMVGLEVGEEEDPEE